MRIVDGFVVRDVAGKTVAISVDPSNGFHGMLSLNSTAKFLWELLASGCNRETLYDALVKEYGIDHEIAKRDADAIVDMLISHGLIRE